MENKKLNRWSGVAAWFIILAGAALRLKLYLSDRSLHIDEANLARNFFERSYAGLFQQLNYEQFAPPFFSVIEKFFCEIFGYSEQSLWLFPFVAGLLSLVFLYRLAGRFLPPVLVLLPLSIFAFGDYFVQYSAILKQYSIDVCIALGLSLLAVRMPLLKLNFPNTLLWMVLGMIAPWLSMPSVFVLFSVGVFYLVEIIRTKDYRKLLPLVLMGLSWLVSFGIYYFLLLQDQVGNEYLQNYHADYFLPFPPTSLWEIRVFAERILSIFAWFTTDLAYLHLAGLLLSLGGLFFLIRQKVWESILVAGPVILCLAAACFNAYALIPRLMLFFAPLLLILLAKGFEFFYRFKPPLGITAAVIMAAAIAILSADGFRYFYTPYLREEIKPVLAYVKAHKAAEDQILVHHFAWPAYDYYSRMDHNCEAYELEHDHYGANEGLMKEILYYGGTPQRMWVVITNEFAGTRQEIIQPFEARGTLLDQVEYFQGAAYLFEIKE